MELNLRPPALRFHPLMPRRRGFAGLGQSNINPTTIWTPSGGFVAGGGAPAVYQAPAVIPTPACASGPAATADSAACIAAVLAAQQQNMQGANNANFTVDYTDCVGQGINPATCAARTYGLTPTGGYTSDAQTQGPQLYQDGSGNFVTPGVIYTGPPLQATSGVPGASGGTVVFSFTNLTSGNTSVFNVGDRWQIQISGAQPNAPVSLTGGQNGGNITTAMGTTDSSGSFATNGQMSAAEVGSWTEKWTVGGAQVASFSFTVNPAAGTSSTAATGGTVTGSMSDLLSASTTIGGSSIPDWALIGGAVVLLFLMMKR